MTSPVWTDALRAAAVFALDPHEIGGVLLKARPGPVRDAWLAALGANLAQRPRRIPASITADRLLGGLDLTSTLASGHAVAQKGVLAEADGGVVVLAMAERAEPLTVSALAAALDTGWVSAQREGVSLSSAARFGVVALDEAEDGEPGIAAPLADRLAVHLDLRTLSLGDIADAQDQPVGKSAGATLSNPQIEALCGAALAMGIDSLRAPLLAARVACGAAALAGHSEVDAEDLGFAARLVLAPRALVMPSMDEDDDEQPPPPEPEEQEPSDQPRDSTDANAETEIVLEAALAVLPPDLLARLAEVSKGRGADGRSGAKTLSKRRGRPLPSTAGMPEGGARLDVLATLRSAAPWQKLRGNPAGQRPAIRREDFRIKRHSQRSESALIFAVDASGSAAAQRLAEAKGAIELLLVEAYARRDRIALIAMRGKAGELVLPSTRALAAAKRRLSGLPGGGGTPLASGIDLALATALEAGRRGFTPTLVLLTDGKANIARDGTPGRQQAMEDALGAARRVAQEGVAAILIDTSPRPNRQAEELANAMRARYAPLPRADAASVSAAIRAVAA